MKSFGDLLKKAREEKRLTQVQLAERSGVGQQTISHYEKSLREPTWLNVLKLADALDLSLDSFRGKQATDGHHEGRGV